MINEDFPAKPPKWRLSCGECGLPMTMWKADGVVNTQCINKHCPQRNSVFVPPDIAGALPEEPPPVYA